MQNALNSVYGKVPYNNFSFAFEGTNQQMPEFLGGDCSYQAEKLAEFLGDSGQESFFVYSTDNCHVAVVAPKNGKIYFMDPLLMHAEPIPVSDLKIGEETIFPSVDRDEHIKTVLRDDDILNVVLEKKAEEKYVKIWERDFRLKELKKEIHPEFKKRTRMEIGGKISLHVSNVREGINWRVGMMVFGGDIFVLRSGHGFACQKRTPDKFDRQIGEVAKCISLMPQDLIEIFNKACSMALGQLF